MVGAEMTQTVDYRVATGNDETDILAVLEEVAPEIPASVDASDSLDPITGIIRECCQSRKSWVAVDADNSIIGFVLARKDMHEQQALALLYIGVSVNSRRRGIFATLMEKLKANGRAANCARAARQSVCHVRYSREHGIYESGV